jgi:hypothetical protein
MSTGGKIVTGDGIVGVIVVIIQLLMGGDTG